MSGLQKTSLAGTTTVIIIERKNVKTALKKYDFGKHFKIAVQLMVL